MEDDDRTAAPTDSAGYGFPAALWRTIDKHPPPGANRLQRWRSPLRGPWLTSVFGLVLLVTLPIVIITGLLSYIAYGPQFGQAIPADVGFLKLPTFAWPANPSWLYRLTQGLHVGLGLVLIPVVLAKLWSVIPRFFAWPPSRSIAQLIERVSLIMLVGGILFEIVTGVLNIQYDYIFGFSFYTAHYFGAWVFIAGFVIHIVIKIPKMWSGLRSLSLRQVLRTKTADTRAQPPDTDGLVATDPAPPTVSRRGALALVGGGALFMAVITAGQTIGGFTRPAALLLPRGRTLGDRPNDFQVNKTFAASQIDPRATGDAWRLTLTGGPTPVVLDRAALAAMNQHTAELPIACVEGWSTTQVWTGVPLRDLARLAGVPNPRSAYVRSLERYGFNQATLQDNQVLHPDALLALRVNGADLSPNHGYPARIIVPALPGVHNTKWVASIDFRAV
ncbi:molybdopterin-dependent oxidoreductase [Mycobacterium crocinum]|uniref:Molybdopterin-dependent oxidoreductase n=1 Tax=Mycolicibacterium crocinum TaxID=388459 RepID=A0ABY3TTC8_9MYCO|nr:molybdopterin-dependent oxidoreductase [Mycolicibacterium crocinum]MCV7217515.1 molybdopterin-dependent oxidoreductase [Mycolicibacterium crocinum]ULN42395.1 molybdopterin-dependent oxidoreductase [Mycolicibacterium crocinum]